MSATSSSTSSWSLEQAEELAGLHLVLLVGLLLRHHVDLPPGELTGEAHVLSTPADRLRELLLVDRDVHRSRFLVDDDRDDLGRRHRVDHVLGGILVPRDDVHPFARELVRHRLDAGAAHADARPHRVDASDVAADPDLRPRAGVARASHDLDESFGDLRHLKGEQVHHQLGRGAADEELGAARIRAHLAQPAAQPVARPRDLARDDLLAHDDRLCVAAQIEDDGASLQTLDHPGHHLADPMLVGVDDLGALGLADLLHDDLLGGLRGDPAERHRLDRLFHEVPDLRAGRAGGDVAVQDLTVRVEDAGSGHLLGVAFAGPAVLGRRRLGEQLLQRGVGLLLGGDHGRVVHDLPPPERLVVARLAVDGDPHVEILGMASAGRARQGGLDRLEDDVVRNALLGRDDLDDVQDLFAHVTRSRGASPMDDCESVSPFTTAAPVSRSRSRRSRSDVPCRARRRGGPRRGIRRGRR